MQAISTCQGWPPCEAFWFHQLNVTLLLCLNCLWLNLIVDETKTSMSYWPMRGLLICSTWRHSFVCLVYAWLNSQFKSRIWLLLVMCRKAELKLGWTCKFTHCFRENINKLKVELMNNMCYLLSFMFHTEPLQGLEFY